MVGLFWGAPGAPPLEVKLVGATVIEDLRVWSGRETLPFTEGMAGMVGFLPFTDSL
jgi:hypothetical protein